MFVTPALFSSSRLIDQPYTATSAGNTRSNDTTMPLEQNYHHTLPKVPCPPYLPGETTLTDNACKDSFTKTKLTDMQLRDARVQ